MTTVGVRDLKNNLSQYLNMVRKGCEVIVTERGKPVAILHDLSGPEPTAGIDEALASLAAAGRLRLPKRSGGLVKYEGALLRGKSITDTILEDRR